MQDLEQLREIQALGLEDSPPPEEEPPQRETSRVPLLQAAVCLVLLAGLLLLRYTNAPMYQSITDWYHQEAAEEIQLPAWGEGEEAISSPSPSPSPSPAATVSPWEENASLQRV